MSAPLLLVLVLVLDQPPSEPLLPLVGIGMILATTHNSCLV